MKSTTISNELGPVVRPTVRIRWPYLLLTLLGLGVVLAVALWLRWQYARDISPSVDEFTTLWVAQRTLETGTPMMPSGVLYPRGLITTYLTALVMALWGDSYAVGRLPSLFFGMASLVAIFALARREWNSRVAWLAVIGLALLPEAVVWSGRARFYAPLQFFTLLMLWAAFETIAPRRGAAGPTVDRPRAPLLYALLFVLALISQEETILFFPAVLLAMWLWRGWRFLWQPSVIAANLICVAAMGVRFQLERVGQPEYFAAMQEHKPYLNLLAGVPTMLMSYSRLFIEPERLPWTLAGLLAIGVALVQLRRQRTTLANLARFHQATLFFALHLVFVVSVIIVVIGLSWNDPRYVFMVQPLWLLLGAAGAVWLVERVTKSATRRWLLTAALAALVVWSLWTPAIKATREDAEGYDAAFRYVAAQRQPGDVILTPQTSACAVVMGQPCDYFARERGFAPYSVERNGRLVDRWSGATVLSTAEELAQVVQTTPRVWFVADYDRLGNRYYTDFLTTLVEQFEKVFAEQGAVVLLAEGWHERPAPVVSTKLAPPLPLGGLSLTRWSRNAATPGQQLYVIFYWKKIGSVSDQVNTSLQIVAADGTRITQSDGPPVEGFTMTTDFPTNEVPDPKKLILPETLAPGRYRIDVVAYYAETAEPLADPVAVDWFQVGEAPPAATTPVGAAWQNGLTLVGHDGAPASLTPGADIPLRLVWQTSTPVTNDYTVFLHLLGPDGAIVAQVDRPPEGGFYPTSGWDVDEAVADNYTLQLPAALPSGDYRLMVGFYDPDTFARVQLATGADAFQLGAWSVAAPAGNRETN